MPTTLDLDALKVREVSFGSVLSAVAKRIGMVIEQNELEEGTALQLAEHMSAAYRYAWQIHDWPEAMEYVAAEPSLEPTFGQKVIPFDATFNTVYQVWDSHPIFNRDAQEIPWTLGDGRGIYLPADAPGSVVYIYRREPVEFTLEEWSVSASYLVGDVVLGADGWHYRALYDIPASPSEKNPGASVEWRDGRTLPNATYVVWNRQLYLTRQEFVATASKGPAGDDNTDYIFTSPQWERLGLLKVLAEATKAGAVSLYQAGDGQLTSAQIMAGAMNARLEDEIMLIHRQWNGSGFTKRVKRTN